MDLDDLPRDRLELIRAKAYELRRREERQKQSEPGGLIRFVRYFWDVLEPKTPLVEGWAFYAICEHLEAVSRGDIKRLLINVPPGFSKSLLTNVFWPLWEWAALNRGDLRYVSFSYAAHLTERDNRRFKDLIHSTKFLGLWGDRFHLVKDGEQLVSNDKMGWKFATSVGGVGTGERGNRVLIDDPHNVKQQESEAVRGETVRWFREAIPNRLNDADNDAIIVIMQRVHEEDVSGVILSDKLGYEHLMIPMEYDPGRHCRTSIGWEDPRTIDGELACPERFGPKVIETFKKMGPYAWASQYQQSPVVRGGNIIKRDWWQLWEPPDGKFPKMDYIIASADTAYTEKEENDPTGFVVLGVYKDLRGYPKVMLMDAWRKRLELHGVDQPMLPGESKKAWVKRTSDKWGLCEWINYSCRRFNIHKLIIENKASGISVAQELRKLNANAPWGVETVNPEGDKVARAYSVQSIFSNGLVFAPDREWAELVISELESFPKGRYRDLTDAVTQALKHLRDRGLLVRSDEYDADLEDQMRHQPIQQPLYPV